jgi:ribosomal protein L7/L12
MKSEVIITEADLPQDVLRAIQNGRKIEAIKLLREATGLGLANAKVLVDRAARQHAPQSVQPSFAESESGLPRLLKSLIVTVLLFALYHYFV